MVGIAFLCTHINSTFLGHDLLPLILIVCRYIATYIHPVKSNYDITVINKIGM